MCLRVLLVCCSFNAHTSDIFPADETFRHQLKTGVVLVPQPSEDPNDPLKWPQWKKALAFTSTCTFTFLTTWFAGGQSNLVLQALTSATDNQCRLSAWLRQYRSAIRRQHRRNRRPSQLAGVDSGPFCMSLPGLCWLQPNSCRISSGFRTQSISAKGLCSWFLALCYSSPRSGELSPRHSIAF